MPYETTHTISTFGFRAGIVRLSACVLLALVLVASPQNKAKGSPAEAVQSVVSVLPVWPGRPQAGQPRQDNRPGTAPEGSGVVIRPGIIATAWHVIESARRIDIRLSDGRVLPTELIGHDAPSDLALLRVDADLAPFEFAETTALAQPVCAIGNAFGLGLSVTCGVVSALAITEAGFNPVEDFIQTDAATNPGCLAARLSIERGAWWG